MTLPSTVRAAAGVAVLFIALVAGPFGGPATQVAAGRPDEDPLSNPEQSPAGDAVQARAVEQLVESGLQTGHAIEAPPVEQEATGHGNAAPPAEQLVDSELQTGHAIGADKDDNVLPTPSLTQPNVSPVTARQDMESMEEIGVAPVVQKEGLVEVRDHLDQQEVSVQVPRIELAEETIDPGMYQRLKDMYREHQSGRDTILSLEEGTERKQQNHFAAINTLQEAVRNLSPLLQNAEYSATTAVEAATKLHRDGMHIVHDTDRKEKRDFDDTKEKLASGHAKVFEVVSARPLMEGAIHVGRIKKDDEGGGATSAVQGAEHTGAFGS